VLTPSQLRCELAELGIHRKLRVLTSWRERGLLPPLRRIGRGRGKGAQHVWDFDVLDQAIAVHWLLKFDRNSEGALVGLWLSGYRVSALDVRRSWLGHLKRIHRIRHTAAMRYKDRFLGLARSGLKTAPGPQWTRDFLADSLDWQYDDDSPFDDEDYKNLIAQGLDAIGEGFGKSLAPSDTSFRDVLEGFWDDIDVPAILRSSRSIEFVQSMSVAELDFAHASLTQIRRAFAHWSSIFDASTDRGMRVMMETKIMYGMVGPFVAKALIALNRAYPELPFARTIALLHDHIHNVKSSDILRREDGTMVVSERVRNEWQTVKETLSRLWDAAFAT
jgi:hypothetical protein